MAGAGQNAIAVAVLSGSPVITGDFGDFLCMLKTPEGDTMVGDKNFNPLMSLEMRGGGAVEDGDTPKPDDDVTVAFVSGVPGEWNYREDMTFREYSSWKLRAKEEAEFSVS